jgi:hypothetical protein
MPLFSVIPADDIFYQRPCGAVAGVLLAYRCAATGDRGELRRGRISERGPLYALGRGVVWWVAGCGADTRPWALFNGVLPNGDLLLDGWRHRVMDSHGDLAFVTGAASRSLSDNSSRHVPAVICTKERGKMTVRGMAQEYLDGDAIFSMSWHEEEEYWLLAFRRIARARFLWRTLARRCARSISLYNLFLRAPRRWRCAARQNGVINIIAKKGTANLNVLISSLDIDNGDAIPSVVPFFMRIFYMMCRGCVLHLWWRTSEEFSATARVSSSPLDSILVRQLAYSSRLLTVIVSHVI